MIKLLEGEVFKPLNYKGFEHYLVSNMGRVQYKNKLRKLSKNKRGYIILNLSNGSERKQFFVHRMVCLTFLCEPIGESNYVNHKNFITDDNRLENLEWCTPKENTQHFLINKNRTVKPKKEKYCPPWIDVERLRSQSKMANEKSCEIRRKKVKLINIDTNKEEIFNSLVELEKETGICRKAIGSVCRGKRKTHKGYTALYI